MIEPTRTIYNFQPHRLAEDLREFKEIPYGFAGFLLLMLGYTLSLMVCFAVYVTQFQSEPELRIAFVVVCLYLAVLGFITMMAVSYHAHNRNFHGYALLVLRKTTGEGPTGILPVIVFGDEVETYLNEQRSSLSAACFSLSLVSRGRGRMWAKRSEQFCHNRFVQLPAWKIISYDLSSAAPCITVADPEGARRTMDLKEALIFFERTEELQCYTFQAFTDAAIDAAGQRSASSAA